MSTLLLSHALNYHMRRVHPVAHIVQVAKIEERSLPSLQPHAEGARISTWQLFVTMTADATRLNRTHDSLRHIGT